MVSVYFLQNTGNLGYIGCTFSGNVFVLYCRILWLKVSLQTLITYLFN